MADTKVRGELRKSFDRLVEARKSSGSPMSMNHPVKVLHSDQVPVTGSVHLASGRVVTREFIEKRFAKLK